MAMLLLLMSWEVPVVHLVSSIVTWRRIRIVARCRQRTSGQGIWRRAGPRIVSISRDRIARRRNSNSWNNWNCRQHRHRFNRERAFGNATVWRYGSKRRRHQTADAWTGRDRGDTRANCAGWGRLRVCSRRVIFGSSSGGLSFLKTTQVEVRRATLLWLVLVRAGDSQRNTVFTFTSGLFWILSCATHFASSASVTALRLALSFGLVLWWRWQGRYSVIPGRRIVRVFS